MAIFKSRLSRFFKNDSQLMKIDQQLLRTGHPLIDSQHEAYLDLLDELFVIGREPLSDKSKVDAALNKACDYGLKHFIAEEQLMESVNYPGLDAHRKKHSEFRVHVEKLQRDGEYMSPDAFLREVNLWMVKWLCDQIRTYDRELADFIKNRNSKLRGKVGSVISALVGGNT